jgi:hypothetical protein
MKKRSSIDSAAHWRMRAEEAHRIANQLDDPVAKRTMKEIAVAYEKLAGILEPKLGTKAPE